MRRDFSALMRMMPTEVMVPTTSGLTLALPAGGAPNLDSDLIAYPHRVLESTCMLAAHEHFGGLTYVAESRVAAGMHLLHTHKLHVPVPRTLHCGLHAAFALPVLRCRKGGMVLCLGVPDPNHKPFEDVVTIAGIKDEVEVLKSLQAPKKARTGTLRTCVSLQIPVVVHVSTMYAILRGTSSSNLLPCAVFGQGCHRRYGAAECAAGQPRCQFCFWQVSTTTSACTAAR